MKRVVEEWDLTSEVEKYGLCIPRQPNWKYVIGFKSYGEI
jgi:hypothetical protein